MNRKVNPVAKSTQKVCKRHTQFLPSVSFDAHDLHNFFLHFFFQYHFEFSFHYQFTNGRVRDFFLKPGADDTDSSSGKNIPAGTTAIHAPAAPGANAMEPTPEWHTVSKQSFHVNNLLIILFFFLDEPKEKNIYFYFF